MEVFSEEDVVMEELDVVEATGDGDGKNEGTGPELEEDEDDEEEDDDEEDEVLREWKERSSGLMRC